MRIISLEAENIKRLRAVSITFKDGVMVIGGRNAQGKTSCLDAIAMALGGKDLVPDKPLRTGEAEGHATIVLGEPEPLYTVTRKFTAKGTTSLTVKSAEEGRMASPQSLLDGLLGALSFDPLAFSRMDGKRQAETLRALVGLDTAKIDAQIQAAYDERTVIGREVSRLEGALKTLPQHEDVPQKEQSVADLSAEYESASAVIKDRDKKLDAANDMAREAHGIVVDIERATTEIASYEAEVIRLQKAIETAQAHISEQRNALKEKHSERDSMKAEAEAIEVPDLAAIRSRMASAEDINTRVRANAKRAEVERELAGTRATHTEIGQVIDSLRSQRSQMIQSCAFPVEGLSLDETGVKYDGIPFAQASSSEQLRVSVAMGLAMNPTLKLLLIRDGSLLDDDNLALLAKMAANADAQVLIERVGSDKHTSVVIEDGMAQGVRA